MAKRERKNRELYSGKHDLPRLAPEEKEVITSPNDTVGIGDKVREETSHVFGVDAPNDTSVSNDNSVKNVKTVKVDKNDKTDKVKKGATVETSGESGSKSPTFHVQIPEAIKPVILEIQVRVLVATGIKHTIAEIITEAVNYYHKNL